MNSNYVWLLAVLFHWNYTESQNLPNLIITLDFN